MRDAELAAAHHRVPGVERERDALVGPALAHGLDKRGVAKTMSLANATVSRRNGSGAE